MKSTLNITKFMIHAGHEKRRSLWRDARKLLRIRTLESMNSLQDSSLTVRKIRRKLPTDFATKNAESTRAPEVASDDVWIGSKMCRLYVPKEGDVQRAPANSFIAARQEMGLALAVPVIVEDEQDNLQFLRHCVDPSATVAEPYLEVLISGSSAAVLYFRGDEIKRELAELSAQIYYQ